MSMFGKSLFLLFCTVIVFAHTSAGQDSTTTAGDSDMIEIKGFVETKSCYDAMLQNDGGNSFLNREGYVGFVMDMMPALGSSRSFEGFANSTFAQLPLELNTVFNVIACLCDDPAFGGDGSDPDCCIGENARIRIPPDPLGTEVPPAAEQVFFFTVCNMVDNAWMQYLSRATSPPTQAPTLSPTILPPPTLPPTILPPPTLPPTPSPTASPIASPTASPTNPPSTVVTVPQPTTVPVVPTNSPSRGPTKFPTTAAPTFSETVRDAFVAFNISITNGKQSNSVVTAVASLRSAMNVLAAIVGQETFGTTATTSTGVEVDAPTGRRRRQLRSRVEEIFQIEAESRPRRRRLTVTVRLPTSVGAADPFECPAGMPENDLCLEMVFTVPLVFENEDPEGIPGKVELYQTNLNNAIQEGRLQPFLSDPNIVVPMPTGGDPPTEPPTEPPTPNPLSAGAIVGIIVACLVLFCVPVCYYMYKKRRLEEENRDEENLSKKKSGSAEPAAGSDSSSPQRSHASSAGDSGWSSSAGVSSYNTSSVDDSMDRNLADATTLAAMGIGSKLAKPSKPQERGSSSLTSPPTQEVSDVPDVPAVVRRDDLDRLIEIGDWAAVGTTAAMLASQSSDSEYMSTRSQSSMSRTTNDSSRSSVNAARAAELDHLVDAGDWEGVVLAAAKFDRAASVEQSAKSGSPDNSSPDSGSSKSLGSGTFGSAGVSEISTDQKRAETRKEVEALVRRVVPEEIDNIDEMMEQFAGREEELVETLRTMQERVVAQKARASGHRAAKLEARRSVQRGVVPGAGLAERSNFASAAAASPNSNTDTDNSFQTASPGGIAAVLGATAAAAVVGGKKPEASPTSSLGSAQSSGSFRRDKRSALELAIEAGDWEAVGQAAAIMSSDASATTMSSGEIDRLAAQESDRSVSTRGSRSMGEGISAARAAELDEMIDRGDWSAVVQTANRFSEADSASQQSPSSKRSAAGGRSKEEEDALAQADMWMKIAKKSENKASDTGASDAAEWAIKRSLSQLKDAERDSKKDDHDRKEEV